MQPIHFEEVLLKIVERDPRFHRDAYLFLREALEYTQRTITKAKRDEVRHVTGQELLDGIRRYAIEQFGPMAATVLEEWGVRTCLNFGEMVFNMIEFNLLAKTETDRLDDFKSGYDFHDAFRKPFMPTPKPSMSEVESVKAVNE